QSLRNLIDHLSDRITFKILTPDFDLGEKDPYPNVDRNRWTKVNGIDIYYISKSNMTIHKIGHIIRNTKHDIRYYNSFFYPYLTVFPLLMEKIGWLPKKPSVLALRGEFAPSALTEKRLKKQLFLFLNSFINIYSNVVWQVSSPFEKEQLLKVFGQKRVKGLQIISNIPPKNAKVGDGRVSNKKKGILNLVYIGRVAKNKNLLGAITLLRGSKGRVTLDVYGPGEDKDYLQLCLNQANQLPENVVVNFHGPVEHKEIINLLRQNDFLFFPSLGENFGHIILESLISGTPAIISDRTPWQDLEKYEAGWVIDLEDKNKFNEVVNHCVQMDKPEHQTYCDGALKKAKQYLEDTRIVEETYQMFTGLLK
ncbi:MAG TPA: glycosyltransferase, partial [Caldithrix abyssi]|nr:glycosyltransferase [Caldithrix abyssi]